MSNIHPLIVHFPIALFIVAVLFDLIGLVGRQRWARQAGMVLMVLAALGAMAALATGLATEESVEDLLGAAGRQALEAHEDIAKPTAYVLLAVAVLRLALSTRPFRRVKGLAWSAYLVAAVIGLGMLTLTAYRGGELVYVHGGGVQALSAPAAQTGLPDLGDDDD